jgi:Zn-finger nucleic acid-binding protein
MRCIDCNKKISAKHYDPEFEWYECPRCEGCWTVEELEASRSPNGAKPKAKAKVKLEARENDAQAVTEYEKEAYVPVKAGKGETKHRDAVPTSQILNILADEIMEIAEESGQRVDELNAREYFAMNLWRVLQKSQITARDAEVKYKLCDEHS